MLLLVPSSVLISAISLCIDTFCFCVELYHTYTPFLSMFTALITNEKNKMCLRHFTLFHNSSRRK